MPTFAAAAAAGRRGSTARFPGRRGRGSGLTATAAASATRDRPGGCPAKPLLRWLNWGSLSDRTQSLHKPQWDGFGPPQTLPMHVYRLGRVTALSTSEHWRGEGQEGRLYLAISPVGM